MIAVIFEVRPTPEGESAYLDHAAALNPLANGFEGFLGVERYRSLTDPGKLLSLSFFEDEDAVARWRKLPRHRVAQTDGRASIFEDYRLRIAEVVRDYGLNDRAQAPPDALADLRPNR